MSAKIFDDRICALGEGPLWHPERGQLFWFDITGRRLLSRAGGEALEWRFDDYVSAAGWVDRNQLLIASDKALFLLDVETGEQRTVAPLEADIPANRSNDGRADPWGGFWIGTMGTGHEAGAGAIYRFHGGRLEKLFGDITIPNSICFSPDRAAAYYTDTGTHRIMRAALDGDGWPAGSPSVFSDLSKEGLAPDGSVVDTEGCLWNAQWGSSRVARYSPEGRFLDAVVFPARQISCPAFGGDALSTLYATSATEGMESPSPEQGRTYSTDVPFKGQAEHRVVLGR